MMVHLLFESFLDDDTEYQACERYWAQLVGRLSTSMGQPQEWNRWISPYYADGVTPVEAGRGNPIFDGRSENVNRAFRIIQQPGNGGDLAIAAWLKSYEVPELPRDELVINIVLSEESALVAEALLRKWMLPTTTADEMESFIHNTLPRPEPEDET